MEKYKITKKGRKWYEGVNEKGFRTQIEINTISKSWNVGDEVEFIYNMKKETSRFGVKIQLFPISKEIKEQQKEYVKNLQKEREINYTIEKAEITADKMIYWINKNIQEDKKWYTKGEDIITLKINELSHINTNKANALKEKLQLQLDNLRDKYTTTKSNERKIIKINNEIIKKAKLEERRKYFTIQTGNKSYKKGDIVEKDGIYGKVIDIYTKYYNTDDDVEYYNREEGAIVITYAKCDVDLATEGDIENYKKEQEIIKNCKEKTQQIKDLKIELKNLVWKAENKIYDEKIFLSNMEKDAIILEDDFSIYGTGNKWIIKDDYVYLIQNNGMDGDDWSLNNIVTGGAGAFGFKLLINNKIKNMLKEIYSNSIDFILDKISS